MVNLADERLKLSLLIQRWMDDLFILLVIFTAKDVPQEQLECIADSKFAEIMGWYTDRFSLKDEDASIFVGFDVLNEVVDLGYQFKPHSEVKFKIAGQNTVVGVEKYRFSHFYSCTSLSEKKKNVLAMMYRAVDCSSDEEVAIGSVMKIFIEFYLVGFPYWIFKDCCNMLVSRHCYLKDIVSKGFVRFLQVHQLTKMQWQDFSN